MKRLMRFLNSRRLSMRSGSAADFKGAGESAAGSWDGGAVLGLRPAQKEIAKLRRFKFTDHPRRSLSAVATNDGMKEALVKDITSERAIYPNVNGKKIAAFVDSRPEAQNAPSQG